MHACRKEATLEAIIAATKSKRYTRTRIDRMVMCAFLGITCREMAEEVPYTRVLAFNDRGREILKQARNTFDLPNIGEKQEHPYQQLENRCDTLYGLFTAGKIESPTPKYRIYHHK